MPNVLGNYNPTFFAQEALIQLEALIGMAGRVHRGYESERNAYSMGEVIQIKGPGKFAVNDAPTGNTAGTVQDLETRKISITLNHYKEVRFALPDKEKAFTGEEIVADHIRPAAVALADYIDQTLMGLYTHVPWHHDAGSTAATTWVTTPRRIMLQNKAPVADGANMHLAVGPTLEEGFLGLSALHAANVRGPSNVDALLNGSMGRLYGVELFASHGVQKHTKGTASDSALAVNGAATKGATTINLDGGGTGTLVPGDTFKIAGDDQRYAVTNTVTAASNAYTGVQFVPPLEEDAADNAVVTVELNDHYANLMFHRNAFALAMAPLPMSGMGMTGVQVATVMEPRSGMSLRVRMYYDGDRSRVIVVLDTLFGVQCLDPNLACRLRSAS